MMKKTILATAVSAALLWQAGAADLNWQTDVPKALAQARTEKKLVLLDFTGSDWCVWCKKMDADTFEQPQFEAYAKTNLILVQVDFPNHKVQSDALKAANIALAKKYGVDGYPTLVALNPDGTQVWSNTGYLDGGPSALIAQLNGVAKP